MKILGWDFQIRIYYEVIIPGFISPASRFCFDTWINIRKSTDLFSGGTTDKKYERILRVIYEGVPWKTPAGIVNGLHDDVFSTRRNS